MKFKFLSLFLIVTSLVYAQDINQFDESGKRHGVWKKYFEGTKQLRYEGKFDHGKEVGKFLFHSLYHRFNRSSSFLR